MGRITNLQNQIGALQENLRERNETIAGQKREIADLKAKRAEDEATIVKLRKELSTSQAAAAA